MTWPTGAAVLNPGPYVVESLARECPARMVSDDAGDDRVWECKRWVKAGRTRHGRTHQFVLMGTVAE